MIQLRPYQQEAVSAIMAEIKRSVAPCLIEAATGAGKSLIIAELARQINEMTGKKVLCLAPSAELVTQNREKYESMGNRSGLFSASAGGRDLRYPVVFGSPLTVKNAISRFCNDYAVVVLDECQGITPTIRGIIDEMRKGNPNLRVVGLTATPYRLGDGYIFRVWPDEKVNGENKARNPYFTRMVYRIEARTLIEAGYLTPPVIGAIGADGYETGGLVANAMGQFDAAAVDRAYHGHGRKTAAIVGDIVAKSAGKRGVMIFAATVRHAQEIMASLPPEISAIVTGETAKPERERILKAFKAEKIKYIVNVSVLTVGFDAPHVDVIALMRKTESMGLLQQIIGRGLRLFPGKTECTVLDYTTNLEDHCPDGDIFLPVIKAKKSEEGAGGMSVTCPECGCENEFSYNVKTSQYAYDKYGYCIDLAGARIPTDWGPLPAHFGRRCWGQIKGGPLGEYERCGYRWTFKECPHCTAANDIAARYCCECKGEIIDPNEKLAVEFKALKKDPTRLQTDAVTDVDFVPGVSQKGNKVIRADWVTPYRKFATWHRPHATDSRGMADWAKFDEATLGGTVKPESVTYRKDPATGFYIITAYDRMPDHAP